MPDEPESPKLEFVPDRPKDEGLNRTAPILVTALCWLCAKDAGLVVVRYDPVKDNIDPDEHNRVFIEKWLCADCRRKLAARTHAFFIPIKDDWDGGPDWERAGQFGASLSFKKLRDIGFPEEQLQTLSKNPVCLMPLSAWAHYKLPLPEGYALKTPEEWEAIRQQKHQKDLGAGI